MGKVVCEKCESSFKPETVEGMDCCPACGEPFDDKEYNSGSAVMYFDIIDIFKEEPQYSNVNAYCCECGENNSLELDKFDKLADKEYVILKEGITVKCRGCGKEHKPRKIMYKRKDHYAPPASPLPGMQFSHAKKDHHRVKVPCGGNYGCICAPI